MEKTPIHKKVAALAVALALSVGMFGGVSYQTAHAKSDSSNSSSLSSMSEANLIALLQDLIKLLENRLQALIDARGGVTNHDSSNDDDSCDDSSSDDTGLTELEAEIFTNETVIQIELDGDKDVVVTNADTRAEIIDAILDEYSSLSEDDVDDMLTVETEDRASRASDKDWADGDDANDDSSCDDDDEDENEDEDEDEDEDDDEDDDNRGHGNSDDDEDDD